jgi:hypothetical protein
MKNFKTFFLTLILSIGLFTGCGDDDSDKKGTSGTDTIGLRVTSTIPAEGEIDVAINKKIVINFSDAMDPATITDATITLQQGETNITGAVALSASGTAVTFTPDSNLTASIPHTATVTTEAKDLAGDALAAEFTLNFTTGAAPDTTPPTVTTTMPIEGASNVPINRNVVISFSEAMDPLTITGSTFTLEGDATNITGNVSLSDSGMWATFTPDVNLAVSIPHTATITIGAEDLAGNGFAAEFTLNFTTGTAIAHGPQPVYLGTAGNYVILAKSGISTTGTTYIVGDIGVSPAAATYITGFDLIYVSGADHSTSALVDGKIYAPDYAGATPANITTAIGDMETAYTDAAGRTIPDTTELGAGDISAMTLAPGLYKWGTGLNIDNRGVTLSGGANDVWIFQIGEKLNLESGAIITLSGGAQAKNIFWQTAGGATLNTTAEFKGILLSKTNIAVKPGAKVNNGRLFAQTAVTLEANPVTQPAE